MTSSEQCDHMMVCEVQVEPRLYRCYSQVTRELDRLTSADPCLAPAGVVRGFEPDWVRTSGGEDDKLVKVQVSPS